jgi:putative Mg2+ transporter-C (MgtC) family protein
VLALFNLNALFVSTGIVALAEVGDKTQLLSLVLAARFRRPWPIIIGIFIATLANHAFAGAIGTWITQVLGKNTLSLILGISFLGMGIWTLIPDKLEDSGSDHGRLGVLGTTIVAFFLAEMGDKTQVATIALAAQYNALVSVVVGTTLGMMIANVPVVFLGEKLAHRLPVRSVHVVAAVLFVGLGVFALMNTNIDLNVWWTTLQSLQAVQNIKMLPLLDSSVSLGAAFLLGAVIGFERQFRQRTAGLRTNTLVAVGAAAFVDIASRLGGTTGAYHVVAYVVSGVGFLGAATILKEGLNMRGLNTAATLWGSAAVGACAGADLIVEAVLVSAFVVASNTLLRPAVNYINRLPLDAARTELSHTVYAICAHDRQTQVRLRLEHLLKSAGYPIREIKAHPFDVDEVEIEAHLLASSVEINELDDVITQLALETGVNRAFWNSSATE